MIESARLGKCAGEELGVGQHVPRADDILQGGDDGFSVRRVHLEEPPRPRRRSRPPENGGDFDMGRKAKLVKRSHGLNLEAAIDENARVAGESRRIA